MEDKLKIIENKMDILLEQKTIEYATNLTVKELAILNPGFSEKKLYLVIGKLTERFKQLYPNEYKRIIFLFGEKRKVIPKWFYEEEMGIKLQKTKSDSA